MGYGFLTLFLLNLPSCIPALYGELKGWNLQTDETQADHPLWRKMTYWGPENGSPDLHDRAAVYRHPDLNSCLFFRGDEPRWGDKPSMDDLWNFRWRDLGATSSKHVCLWRLASYLSDADKVSQWFRNQGFRSNPRKFTNSAGQSSVIVDAGWSLRASGSRTPCRGFCFMQPIPYAMVVTSHWSADGKTLLALSVDYNTL
ncbi:MAG: hypothetical protein M9905_02050 [Rhizobiaceae bacterium]|nr:hypothetical protein [Rhizobiaceae bacterium]